MLILKAVLMGIVEGITEFLPISSTGHLIIVGSLINFTGDFATMFEIIIQLGAILAVVYYFRNKIIDSIKNIKPGNWGFKLWVNVAGAFIPAAVLGLLTKKFIEKNLFSSFTVSVALIIGAVLMLAVQKYYDKPRYVKMESIGLKKSLLIGLAQCMSLFPGMSRSASTIMGGMVVGLSIKAAAEFSFFLAIPTMFAATGLSLIKGFSSMTLTEWEALGVGFVVSFIVAFIVIDKFLAFLSKRSLNIFAYYRLIVGIAMILLVSKGIIV